MREEKSCRKKKKGLIGAMQRLQRRPSVYLKIVREQEAFTNMPNQKLAI